MSVHFRVRVDEDDLAKADAVAESVGTKTPEIVRMFIHQVARTGKVPISMSAQDELLDVKRRNRILSELDDAEGW